MIENTVFENKEEIISVIKDIYGLDITEVKKVDRGSANIYSLNNDKYILKEFQSRYSKEQIDKEIAVINHLKASGIQVPIYIKTLSGEYDFVYKEKTIIMQEFIEGYVLDNNEGTYEQTIECATVYGKIVKALETLPIELPSSDLSDWYSPESFEKGIKKHEELLDSLNDDEVDQRIKKDLLEKIEMIKEISSGTDFSEMTNLTEKNTHGDYNILQFIYKDGKINAVIDFVSATKMPIVWELIRSYSYIDKDAKDGEFNLDTFVDYIKEFTKYVELNKYDLKYMAYLYLIQILSSNFGYKQYVHDHEKTSLLNFGFYRTNICRFLFKNVQVIANRLDSEL
ncbi:MAG: phosphotransferase [Candidatus Aphodocola sp.]